MFGEYCKDSDSETLKIFSDENKNNLVLSASIQRGGERYHRGAGGLSVKSTDNSISFYVDGCRESYYSDPFGRMCKNNIQRHKEKFVKLGVNPDTLLVFFLDSRFCFDLGEAVRSWSPNRDCQLPVDFLPNIHKAILVPELWMHLFRYVTYGESIAKPLFISNHLSFFIELYGAHFARKLIQPYLDTKYSNYSCPNISTTGNLTLLNWQYNLLGYKKFDFSKPISQPDHDFIAKVNACVESWYCKVREGIHRQLNCTLLHLFRLPCYILPKEQVYTYFYMLQSIDISTEGMQISFTGDVDKILELLEKFEDIWQLDTFYTIDPKDLDLNGYKKFNCFQLRLHIQHCDVEKVINNMMSWFFKHLNEDIKKYICKKEDLPTSIWHISDYPSAMDGYLRAYCSREDLLAFNDDGLTPLHLQIKNFTKYPALSYGDLKYFESLIRHGATICFDSKCHFTPLHLLYRENQFSKYEDCSGLMKQVLEKYAKISKFLVAKVEKFNQVDIDGNTYLHGAVTCNMPLDLIRELCEKGVPFDVKNKSGLRPVDIARDKGRQDVIDYLSNELPNRIMLAKALERRSDTGESNIQAQLSQIMQRVEAIGTEVSGRLDRLETRMGSVEIRLNQFESQRNEQPDLAQHPMSLRPSGCKH